MKETSHPAIRSLSVVAVCMLLHPNHPPQTKLKNSWSLRRVHFHLGRIWIILAMPRAFNYQVSSINNTICLIKFKMHIDVILRVFVISGNKKAIEETDSAASENEDASSEGEEDNEELHKCRNCWKIKSNALRRLPSTRYGLIHDITVAAILLHASLISTKLLQS